MFELNCCLFATFLFDNEHWLHVGIERLCGINKACLPDNAWKFSIVLRPFLSPGILKWTSKTGTYPNVYYTEQSEVPFPPLSPLLCTVLYWHLYHIVIILQYLQYLQLLKFIYYLLLDSVLGTMLSLLHKIFHVTFTIVLSDRNYH